MKTIKFLSESIKLMKENGTPANITVGTFNVVSRGNLVFWAGGRGTFDNYKLSFEIEFRPDHIQHLIDMGVKIDLSKVKRSISTGSPFYAEGKPAIKCGRYYKRNNGVCENWLNAPAMCDIDTLNKLDEFCRDNHLHHIAIHNDTCTKWGKSKYSRFIDYKANQFYKKVRQNLSKKSKKENELLPVEKIAIGGWRTELQ